MSELDQYDYDLPADLIAQQPLVQRPDARLLVVNRASNSIEHAHVRDLPDWLAAGDCLVLNDTRVVPARLVGHRTKTCGRWHGLFVEAGEQGTLRILSKTRGKLEVGESVTLQDRQGRDDSVLRLLVKLTDGGWVVRPEPEEYWLGLLDRVGRVPLPHYIRDGEMVDADVESYQTVFAERPGAVAAPTAGLHFTEKLLDDLDDRGIGAVRVTLHVGLGTFRPVSVPNLSDHKMHYERGRIDEEAVRVLQATRDAGRRIVAVGTTSMRLLETAAQTGSLISWEGETDLFIRPPFQFQAADALMTNFHLPRSTLLVLVRTFGGDRLLRRAYQEAIEQRYRFFSYGDAMLIL